MLTCPYDGQYFISFKHLKKISLSNMEEIQYVSHTPDICKCCDTVHQKHAATDITIMIQYATAAVQKFWELSVYTVVFKAMTSRSHGSPQLLPPSSGRKAFLFKYIHLLKNKCSVLNVTMMIRVETTNE